MKVLQALFLASLLTLLSASTIDVIEKIIGDAPETQTDLQILMEHPEIIEEVAKGFGELIPDPNHIPSEKVAERIEEHILRSIVAKVQNYAKSMPGFQNVDGMVLTETFDLLSKIRARRFGRGNQASLAKLDVAPPAEILQEVLDSAQKAGNMNVKEKYDEPIVLTEKTSFDEEQAGQARVSLMKKLVIPGVGFVILAIAYVVSKFLNVDGKDTKKKGYKKESYDEETQNIVKNFRNLKD